MDVNRLRLLILLMATPACTDTFEILTLNVRWDAPSDGPNRWAHRKDSVAKLLNERRPDFVALQEVQQVHLHDLMERMPGWFWMWEPKTMLAVVTRSMPVRTGTVSLPGVPIRGAQIIQLRDVTFASLHLGGTPEDQNRAARALLDELAKWPRPWVIAGDMNALPIREDEWPEELGEGTALWEILTAPGAFVDGYKKLHPGTIYTTGNGFGPWQKESTLPVDGRLDWILATDEMDWESTEILWGLMTPEGGPISDHWPVVATLNR